MKSVSIGFVLFAVLLANALACSAQESEADSGWLPLFNGKNLDGFDTFLDEKNPLDEGSENIFTVHDGMIHIHRDTPQGVKAPFGYFATQKEYSHYHLRLEYKWGKKKFVPRMEAPRDSGVIYHMVGPHVVWPRGVECQIQEHDTGDLYTVMGARITTTVDPKSLVFEPLPTYQFLIPEKGGVFRTQGTAKIARVIKSITTEKEGWNRVEVIVRGSESYAHIVNGVINNRGRDIRQLDIDGETWVPLKKGKILFQVEGAEVFYRNIEIKELPES